MSAAQLSRRIRSTFIKDRERPAHACSFGNKGGPMDARRWDGRPAEACLKQWVKVRREATKFKDARDRVPAMELTGNPDDDVLDHCAQLIYSEGGRVVSHLYDCIRHPDYYIKKPFPFFAAYQLLSSKNTLLDAVGATKEDSEGKDEREESVKVKKKNARPLGVKAAKKQKPIKHHEPSSVEKSASDMSISVSRI
ncbi:hypothetical protein BWQ96_09419 [Gracilariopsis chorda]|uniref:Uncharacterized protein n=1 Tax=Gracilariopsis chorda TaxID=448386 RepID=A0A2V3IFM1_9FLOR|nr:hypothetical protein BWQ96_09419 [Gracilariopsis chorda]|eukprot:PXF40874.1 hypothetical protein BWQ96_09419 [Gracilariopsis chorda]